MLNAYDVDIIAATEMCDMATHFFLSPIRDGSLCLPHEVEFWRVTFASPHWELDDHWIAFDADDVDKALDNILSYVEHDDRDIFYVDAQHDFKLEGRTFESLCDEINTACADYIKSQSAPKRKPPRKRIDEKEEK